MEVSRSRSNAFLSDVVCWHSSIQTQALNHLLPPGLPIRQPKLILLSGSTNIPHSFWDALPGLHQAGVGWELEHWLMQACRDQWRAGVLVQTSITFWGGSLHLDLPAHPRSESGLCAGEVLKYQWHKGKGASEPQQRVPIMRQWCWRMQLQASRSKLCILKVTESVSASWESGLEVHRDTTWSFELCLECPFSRTAAPTDLVQLELKEVPLKRSQQGRGSHLLWTGPSSAFGQGFCPFACLCRRAHMWKHSLLPRFLCSVLPWFYPQEMSRDVSALSSLSVLAEVSLWSKGWGGRSYNGQIHNSSFLYLSDRLQMVMVGPCSLCLPWSYMKPFSYWGTKHEPALLGRRNGLKCVCNYPLSGTATGKMREAQVYKG